MTFDYGGTVRGKQAKGHTNDTIVRHAIALRRDDGQGMLWDECVQLSDTVFRLLKEHPVPVWQPAIKAIAGKSMAIDIYIWLTHRLHVLQKPAPVSWAAIYDQFGAGRLTDEGDEVYRSPLRAFKPEFRTALRDALSSYEEARVEETNDRHGLILPPSPPPVPERLIARSA